MFFSCFGCCSSDPQRLYEIGMQYKELHRSHPYYGVDNTPSDDQSYTFLEHARNLTHYLKKAADRGHVEALYEYGIFVWDYYGHGEGESYIKNAADKGHLLAKQWIISNMRNELEFRETALAQQQGGGPPRNTYRRIGADNARMQMNQD